MTPSLEMELLNMAISSKKMSIFLLEEKLQKVKLQCLDLYQCPYVSVLQLGKVSGHLTWLIQAVIPTRLNSRFLQQQEIHALKEMKSSLPNIWEILISEQIVTVEYQSGGLGISSQGWLIQMGPPSACFSQSLPEIGTPTIDLFALRLLHQVVKYLAWKPDPYSIPFDGITFLPLYRNSQNWHEFKLKLKNLGNIHCTYVLCHCNVLLKIYCCLNLSLCILPKYLLIYLW